MYNGIYFLLNLLNQKLKVSIDASATLLTASTTPPLRLLRISVHTAKNIRCPNLLSFEYR